jgi:predicted nucleic acid-binding protein
VQAFVEREPAARAWIAALLAANVDAHVPGLVFVEAANALATYVRGGRIEYDDADESLEKIASLPLDVVPTRMLGRQALALATRRGMSAYDACYIALAIGYDAVLVTADRRLAAEAERSALLPDEGPPGY